MMSKEGKTRQVAALGSVIRRRGFQARIPIALGLLLFSGLAAATTTINNSFIPATINQGDASSYRITIANDSLVPLTSAAVTVLLPGQIQIADPQSINSNSCGFTVNAADPGTSRVYLTGGVIPAGTGTTDGLCSFEVVVRSQIPGNHVANIPANSAPTESTAGYSALEGTTEVFNTTQANATLSVSALAPPTGTKSFSPSPAVAGDPTRLTITLTNPNAGATIPLTLFTDTLPEGTEVADPADASIGCSGNGAVNGSLTADPGADSVTLTGGTIGAGGACVIGVGVVVAEPGGITNSLGEGAIGNSRGLISPAFSRDLSVNTPIAVTKSISPDVIPAGQPALMTIRIANNSLSSPLAITGFADDLAGTTLLVRDTQSLPVPAPADPVVVCTGTDAVDGTLGFAADSEDSVLRLSGATAGPGGACTITAYVTSFNDGVHANSIAVDAVENPNNFPSPAASADLGVNAQLTVDKTATLTSVAPGQWTRFTVTIRNWSGGEVTNVNFLDQLPANGDARMVLQGANPVSSVGCVGGTWSGDDNSPTLEWSGGTIVAGSGLDPGICTVVFDARLPADAATGLSFSNQIPADAISGEGGDGGTISNPGPSPAVNIVSVSSVAVNKAFSPASIPQGGQSTLTIRIRNRVVNALTAVDLTDNLPEGVTLSANPAATNTCGGALQVFPNSARVILTGGAVPARPDDSESAECVITVRVTGSTVGNYENIITPGDFSSSVGSIPANTTATLGIGTGLSGSKSFSPTSVAPGGIARVKISVLNGFNGTLTNVSLTDPLGTGLTIANPANASTNCGGAPTIVANPGTDSAQLLGATLSAGGSCDLFFDVLTSGEGDWINTIPAGNITSAEGPASTDAVTATLAEASAQINLNKSFDPVIVTGGVPSVLRIDVVNPSAITMQGVGLTDTFPLGIEVYSVPDASTTCPGGQVAAIPGDNKLVLSGAAIPPNQTCQVFVTTTSVRFLNLTNSIPVGAIVSDQGYTNPEGTIATLSTLQGLGVMKGFAPAFIGPGQISRLKIRLVSTLDPNAASPVTLTGVSYTDRLPVGMFIADSPNASTTCAGTGPGGEAVVATGNDADSGLVTISQGTIPPNTNCTLEVDVTVDELGAYTNIIPEREVQSDQGVVNEDEASATLNVVEAPTLAKAFEHATRNPGQPNRLTVTITNNDTVITLTGVTLTDMLPAGLAIAPTPDSGTDCAGGQVIADPGEGFMRLIGASIGPDANCTFYADVVGNAPGNYSNFIAAESLSTDQGLTNPGPVDAAMRVGMAPMISKAFDPVGIASGGTSTLTITLTNPNAEPITLTAPLIDALPGNLFVAALPNAATTCTGVLTANAGDTGIRLDAGAQLPADADCTISVDVTGSVDGVFTNVIAAGQLQTSTGTNPSPATASLAISALDPLVPPTLGKTFSPGTIMAGGTSTLTLSLGNPNSSLLTLSANFVDNLPTGVKVADPADLGGTCTLPSVTAEPESGSITYGSGAEIPAGGCTITVAVTSDTGGSYTNTVPSGALVTNSGANLDPANAGLVVQTPTPPTVAKAFSPNTINPGGVARLTISLGNANADAITLSADLVDTLPIGVTVAATPNIGGTCTGDVTATVGSGTITYASGAAIPDGGCTIAVDVTADDDTASPFVNTIPAGALQTSAGNNGAPATANLLVNPPQPPSLSKFFTPSTILTGGTTTLTLSFGNGNSADTTLTADLVDTLPAGVFIAAAPNIQVANGCAAGSVVANAGAVTVTYQSGAPIPAGGCSVSVDVTSSVTNNAGHLNSIPAGALQTGFGNNAVGTGARLRVTGLGVDKVLVEPGGPYAIGDEVPYRLTVTVPGGLSAISPVVVEGMTLTDVLPAGVEYVTGSYSLVSTSGLIFGGSLPTDFTDTNNTLSAGLGTVRNTTGASQTFEVSYRVRVLDIPSNTDGATLTNAVTLSTDDTTQTWSDTADATVGEPDLGIAKTMTPTTGLKTGDIVTITLTATNSGDVPVYGIDVTDVLNDGVDNELFALDAAGVKDTSLAAVAGEFDFAYDEGNGTISYTAKDGVDLAANGGQVIFSFTATVGPDIRSGWTYTNQASVQGNSQNDPEVGRDTPVADSNIVTAGTQVGAVAKTIAETSEGWTTGANVAIGEVITYEMAYSIPRGETRSPLTIPIFTDTLPNGQQFLTGTATIQASVAGVSVANGGSLATTPIAIAPSVDGQQLGFDVGDVQSAAENAQVVIRFDALVLNTAVNNRGDQKTNTATLNYLNREGTEQSLSATQVVRIQEPTPAVTKAANPTTAGGGDTVTFTVVASNTPTGGNRTWAWDIAVVDTLPVRYQNLILTGAVLSRDSVNVLTCGGVSLQTLTLTMDCLDPAERYLAPGESITLTYTATLDPNIAFDEVVTNTVQVQGTSLPGSNGTEGATPGAPDSDTGERTGSGDVNTGGQAVNDLAATNSATVTANRPSIGKAVADDSLQIGDVTTATITVSVPVGQTDGFVVTDVLPAGLLYTGTPITITLPETGFSATGIPDTNPGAGPGPLEFDFGTVQNSAATSQDIVIAYDVQVANVIGNQRNTTLTNTATLAYDGASEPLPSAADTITVREPSLALGKTITAGTPASAGSEVSYRLTVTNSDAFATAYRMTLIDVLPADLLGANGGTGPFFTEIQVTNPEGTVVKTAGGALTAADADQTNPDTLAWPPFDLPPETTLTITYKATVVADAVTGATLTNTVEAEYNSLAAGDAGRDGSDILDDTDDTQLDNYGQTTSRDLTLDADIAIQKTLTTGQDANLAIGEEVQFDLKVSLLPGVTRNLIVTDTLPVGLAFVELVTIEAGDNVSYTQDPVGVVEDPEGVLTIDMGDVGNTPGATDNFFILRIKARVENIADNQNGDVLTNNVAVTSDIGSDSDSLDVTVVEPILQVNKTPDTTAPALGNLVTYSVTVSHASGSAADAYQVELADVIPAGLTYQLGSTMGEAAVDETDPAAPVFSLGFLEAGGSKTFSYLAAVDLDAVVGAALENSISGTFASTADADGSEDSGRDGSDGEGGLNDYVFDTSAAVTPTTTAFLYPVKTVDIAVDGGVSGQLDPSDTLEYSIVLSNEGTDATGVVFTDSIPANTTYVAGSLSSTVGTTDESADPLVVEVGDLAGGAEATITFRVTVDSGTALGTIISNQGLVDSNQTVPTPTDADGVSENGFQPTDIPVGGQPSVQSPLYAEKGVILLTDVAGNGVVNPGDTLRYSLVLSNNGDEDLTNVSLTDTIPTGLIYVSGSANATGGTPTVVGQSLSWSVPTLAAGDFEVLVFNVTVDNPLPGNANDYTFTNQGATDSDQTLPGLTDGNSDPTDGFQPTEIEATTGAGQPRVDAQKRWTLASDRDGNGLANPGDVIGYSISVANTGSAATVDARLADAIPPNTSLVPGSVTTDLGVVVDAGDPIAVNLGSLLPGDVATVRFRVTIDADVADGTVIANQATVTGNNFGAVPSDDNGNPADGLNPTLTPVVTDDPAFATPGGLTKTLAATSEAASSGSDLLIGEVATFRVGVQMPPGTLRDALIEDVLPAGLGYIPGTARLSRTFTTGLNASRNPGDINVAASGVFVDLIDGSELQQSGQTISLLLGDVINSDAAAAAYTLEYQAVVRNVAANQAGTTLSNQARLRYLNGLNQPSSLTPVSLAVKAIEPTINLSKSVDPMTLLPGGGTVTYTLIMTNEAGAATAYDAVISDPIPADWDLTGVDIDSSGGATGITDRSDLAGNSLALDVGQLPAGAVVTIIYTLVAPAGLSPGDTIPNTATGTWTSLPGEKGTDDATPGNPGDPDGERTGSGTGANDFTTSDSALVRVGQPVLSKQVLDRQSRYAIGDEVDYELRLSVPPATVLDGAVLEDVLADGLDYVAGSLLLELDGLSADTTPSDFAIGSSGDDTTLTADFGSLANTTGDTRTLVATYRARIANQLGNQDNQSLINRAELAFIDPGTGEAATPLLDADSVTVGEPLLALAKTITSPTTGLEAGARLDFRVVVTNNGSTAAFATVLSDTLPVGLQDVTDLEVTATSGGAPVPTFPDFNPGDQGFDSAPFNLPVGASVTLAFRARLTDLVVEGQAIQNQVLASFSSRDGDDPNARDGRDGGDQTDPEVLNNYNTSAKSPIITVDAAVTLDKAFYPDPGNARYTIGEEVGYRLTLGVIEGVTRDVVIVDSLPAGVSFISADIGLGNAGITTERPTGPDDQPTAIAGGILTFDLGNLSNPANGNVDDDVVTVDIRVRVDNILENQNGIQLGNNAHVSYLDFDGDEQRVDFDADLDEPGLQPLDLDVVEPDLELSKTADRPAVSLGDEVTFTLTIDHSVTSTADAFDLVVEDRLPMGLSYVPGSANPAPSDVDGQTLRWDRASLTLGDATTSLGYRARVETSTAVAIPLTNRVVLGYASQPDSTGAADGGRNGEDGPDGALNNYAAVSEASVTPTADTSLYAVKGVAIVNDVPNNGQLDPGDTLEYSVVVTNQGTTTASGVVFTDPVPLNTTYIADSLVSDAGVIDQTDPTRVRVEIGQLESGASLTIRFQVRVDAPLPPGVIISNQGVVSSDQTVPTPTDADGIPENGFQPTDIVVGERPTSALRFTKTYALSGDLVAPAGTINVGDQITYRVVLLNTGQVDLTNLVFADEVPLGLDPPGVSVTGVTTTQGTAPAPVGNTIEIGDIGTLAPGASVLITITGIANAAGEVVNQARASSDQLGSTPSDGDGNPDNGAQPTVFPVVPAGEVGAPGLSLAKRAVLIDDANSDGLVNPGETLRFTLVAFNQGSAMARDVRLSDRLEDARVGTLLVESVTTSQGAVSSLSPLEVNLGDLAPGASATVTYLVTADEPGLLRNEATIRDDSGDSDTDTVEIPVEVFDPFDPPTGRKVVSDADRPELEWTMVWLNPNAAYVMPIRVVDPIPANSTFVDGSLECLVEGVSETSVCEYDAAALQVVFEGRIGPDPGATGADDAANEIVIVFRTRIQDSRRPVVNQAFANWDEDGNGSVDDDQTPVTSGGPTRWNPTSPTAIPAVSVWGLLLCMILMAGIGYRHHRGGTARNRR
ncbi:DUF7933 domain-containing protein [Thiocapsa bogorovii]|uniref:DUF7933 domain-containing protein n=1 Tax=Thiocapsa bogorovii TaxID=521689 RepID=UPI001E37107A|nr:isopeptide-forming domain-containing fimbrial protein [Thiocapsa bogorovii]UHD18276.1 DUF11 domain-containing protein [Thiocapsa bogorovii]